MKVTIVYTQKAIKALRKLPQNDAQKIVKKVRFYTSKKDPLKYAKKLKAPFQEVYRFRIGVYRVLFDSDAKGAISLLTVLTIAHRKDVYE